MKPLICVCCGEKISSKKSEESKNPNVCQPCEYLVETGTIPALEKLIHVLTNLLARNSAGGDLGAPLKLAEPISSEGQASERIAAPCRPVIHPKFIKNEERTLCASNAERN